MKATERNREIRRILGGFVTYELNGAVLTAAKNLLQLQADGVIVGAGKARTLGISEKLHQFRFSGDVDAVYGACQDAFFRLGRRVYLYTAPDALAMLYHPIMRHSLLITMEGTEEELLLGMYTARSLQTRLNFRLTYRRLLKELPAVLEETEVTMTPESQKPAEPEEAEKPEAEKKPAKPDLRFKNKKKKT